MGVLAVIVLAAIDPAVGGIAAALVAAAGAYLAAAKRFSGRIESSDAAQLWEESRSIRAYLNEEITGLKTRIAGLEREIAKRDRRIAELEGKLA